MTEEEIKDEIVMLNNEYFEEKIPTILGFIVDYFYNDKNLNNPNFLSFAKYDYGNFKSIILDLFEAFEWKIHKIKLDKEINEGATKGQE